MDSIAVIGAGISGLTLGVILKSYNIPCIIYEKYDSIYFFDAHSFKDMDKVNFFELTESFRQEEDQKFCDLLNLHLKRAGFEM